MKSNVTVRSFNYNKDELNQLALMPQSKNWPHVYLIHDDLNLYVGETQSILNRTKQHLDKKDVAVKPRSAKIEIINDSSFNKSAILDIEQQLIQLFSAENRFKLLNANGGQSCLHDYYQKDYYHNELLENIWNELLKRRLATKPVYLLKNLDLFKYSPYVSLTQEQFDVCEQIMCHMAKTLPCISGTFVVHGAAGTGKTVLSIFLLSILRDLINNAPNNADSEDYDSLVNSFNLTKSILGTVFKNGNIKKIGFVVPMTSLRKTLDEVFSQSGLKNVKVIGPYDVVKGDFDILFVDEAHRLFRYKNLMNRGQFKTCCEKLDLDYKVANQLQWIMKKSKYTVLFYDENQSVRGSDITKKDFKEGIKMHNSISEATLTSQLRVSAGGDYLNYIDSIFACEQKTPMTFSNYEIAIFDDIKDLIELIKEREEKFGLSRLIAGYGWKWKTKGLTFDEINKKDLYDIDINGTHLIWNTVSTKWINSKHAIDEVGCIHTTQGYDLRFAGIIFGPDIDYDPVKNELYVLRENFYDSSVKDATTDLELKQFVINAYKVMMKRGMQGTYVYAYNKKMRDYLANFFPKYKKDIFN